MISNNQFTATKEFVYDKCGLEITQIQQQEESVAYEAHTFKLNNKKIVFRAAKITPTKIGQFVTLWKRIENGPTQPYNSADDIDFFIVSVCKDENFGQFVFPKHVLIEKDIVAKDTIGGKRGIRVYPPWDTTNNKQAQKTQNWQLDYFLTVPKDGLVDFSHVKALYLL